MDTENLQAGIQGGGKDEEQIDVIDASGAASSTSNDDAGAPAQTS